MLRLSARQRAILSATVCELANYGAAALVFGQLVGQGTVSLRLLLAGVLLWFVFVAAALALERD